MTPRGKVIGESFPAPYLAPGQEPPPSDGGSHVTGGLGIRGWPLLLSLGDPRVTECPERSHPSMADCSLHLALPFLASGASESNEDSLVSRARAGDERAFARIHQQYNRSVYRFLKDLLRDDARAQEATQETFVRAFTHLHSLRDEQKLGAWLLGIARHVSQEHMRASRRVDAHDQEPLLDSLPSPTHAGMSPEELVLGRESVECLAWALPRISEERRVVLLLRVDHGLSCAEVASILGWSVAKVKVELHRARQQLRELIERYEDRHDASR